MERILVTKKLFDLFWPDTAPAEIFDENVKFIPRSEQRGSFFEHAI